MATRFGMGEFLKKEEKGKSLYEINQELPEDTGMSTQEKLAYAGMVPGATGMGADLMSAALYLKEGDWRNTLWSLASFIPIAGMLTGAKKIRTIQKLKNHKNTIKKLEDRTDLSKSAKTEIKNAKKELTDYMDGDTKRSRGKRIQNQGGNENHPHVRKSDRTVESSVSSKINKVIEESKIDYEGLQSQKVSGAKSSEGYSEADRLFRDLGQGKRHKGIK